jgi:hypothetical protein
MIECLCLKLQPHFYHESVKRKVLPRSLSLL